MIALAFLLVQCPEWEGGLGSEEVDFRRMAPRPPRALEAGGPDPSRSLAPDPRGADVRGYRPQDTGHLVPTQGPSLGRGI